MRESHPTSGNLVMQSEIAATGGSGERPTVVKENQCKRWAPDTAHPRAFPQCESWRIPMNFRQIADVVMSASSADETEVLGFEENESLTRFANNCIHQNVTEKNVQITVRSVIATKIEIGRASCRERG